jgi:hypothetical protein
MKSRSFFVLLFAVGLGLAIAACSDTPSSPTGVSTITVTGLVPAVGGTAQFTATATLSGGTTQDVTSSATWTSSNPNIAQVSAAGVVTSLASGTATISATYSGVAGSDAITVP